MVEFRELAPNKDGGVYATDQHGRLWRYTPSLSSFQGGWELIEPPPKELLQELKIEDDYGEFDDND